MQVPDAVMAMYFELLTDLPLDEVKSLIASRPKEAKLSLGRTVIGQYHGAEAAEAAVAQWEREIGQGGVPDDVPEAVLPASALDGQGMICGIGLLKGLGLCSTTSEAIRLIEQGGAYIYRGDEKIRIEAGKQMLKLEDGTIVRAGKKKAARVKLGRD